jgi:hypothetical protein
MHRNVRLFIVGMAVLAALVTTMGHVEAAPRAVSNWLEPRIAIVWPHDGSGKQTNVANSRAVNVSVWPSNTVTCAAPEPSQKITLWRASNNEPAAPVDTRWQYFYRKLNNVDFVSMEFNDVPADIASNPANRYYFLLGDFQGNVWVDATDARTYLPYPVTPAGISQNAAPTSVDTRIQIAYPHDKSGNFATLETATLVNVAVDIFEHGTLNSVPLTYNAGPILLYIAEANYPIALARAETGSVATVAMANLEPYTVANGTKYPRWVFNNVMVEPGKQYHYMVRVQGVETFPSIWTHATDVRTYLPNPPVPPACKW